MKTIEKRRNKYAVFLVASAFPAIWFTIKLSLQIALFCGAACVTALICLVRQSILLSNARLICDNRIIAAPSAVISRANGRGKRHMPETVVSTFGILTGNQIYQWGCIGAQGVKLRAVEIDKDRMILTFGDENGMLKAALPHGLTDEQTLMEVRQRLWRETGITATVSNWEPR